MRFKPPTGVYLRNRSPRPGISKGCSVIVWMGLWLQGRYITPVYMYNNDDIIFFSSVYQRLQSPRVIMCCSPRRFANWAATQY